MGALEWGSGNQEASVREGEGTQLGSMAFTWHLLCTQSSGEAVHRCGRPRQKLHSHQHTLCRASSSRAPGEGLLGEAFLNPKTASQHLSFSCPHSQPPSSQVSLCRASSCLFPEESRTSNQTLGRQFFNLQLQTLIPLKLILQISTPRPRLCPRIP